MYTAVMTKNLKIEPPAPIFLSTFSYPSPLDSDSLLLSLHLEQASRSYQSHIRYSDPCSPKTVFGNTFGNPLRSAAASLSRQVKKPYAMAPRGRKALTDVTNMAGNKEVTTLKSQIKQKDDENEQLRAQLAELTAALERTSIAEQKPATTAPKNPFGPSIAPAALVPAPLPPKRGTSAYIFFMKDVRTTRAPNSPGRHRRKSLPPSGRCGRKCPKSCALRLLPWQRPTAPATSGRWRLSV